MPHCSQVVPASLERPEWAMTKLVSSSLMGVLPLTGSPSFWAAHCSQRCFSIFLPPLISVRCTVADLLQLSHFMGRFAFLCVRRIVFRSTASVNENRGFYGR